MRLKNNGMPPGGIRFQDPRVTAMKWLDDHTNLGDRIKEVIAFRKQNPLIYDSVKDAAALNFNAVGTEIINFNCARLGNDPNWCYDETKSQINIPPPNVVAEQKTCPTCGCQLIARYCKTCGGGKINGYDCPQCKKSF
jgi:hypothetical protein